MGYKGNIVKGEFPDSGAIFMSNTGTKKECFRRQLFGLPLAKSDFVLHVKKGMLLFLFEFERRQLHGVFRATSNGEINIESDAFRSTGKHFPAQVRFTRMLICSPLDEHEFQDAIRDNYFSRWKFNFGLSKNQVRKLLVLFQSKRIPKKHPSRNSRTYDENPAEGDGRFGDLRKKLVRNRLGLVSQEDAYDIDREYVDDEVKEVDGHVYLKEKVNNFDCRRGQVNMYDMDERAQKDDRGLQRVEEAGFHSRDVNDGYDVHNNHGEIRGMKGKHDIEDSYRKIFTEPNGKHFGEISVESNDSKLTMDGVAKDFMDGNRLQDEYHAIQGFRKRLSEHDLGSPRDRGSRTINDGWFFGHEPVESEIRSFNEHSLSKPKGTCDIWIDHSYDGDCSDRSITPTEHLTFKPKGTTFGIKPDDDENLGFTSVGPPYTHDSVRGISWPNSISFSDSMQNTSKSAGNPISELSDRLQHPFESGDIGKAYDCELPYSTLCDTPMVTRYDPEFPDIPLEHSSYLTPGPSSSPVDDYTFYPNSKEMHRSLSSETRPFFSQNVGSMRHFDDPGYALSSKTGHTISSHETRDNHVVKGNWAFKTNSRAGSQGPFFSEFASPTADETAEHVIKGHGSYDVTSTMSPFSAHDNRYHEPIEPRSQYMRKVSEPSHVFKKFSLFDSDLRPCEEDPILPNKLFFQPHENKHFEGTDKRGSVFDRLTSVSDGSIEQEHNTDENHDLDASVNKFMKMLETVVSSPSAMKQDENTTAINIIDFELSKVKMEHEADDLTDESEDGGSIVQEETRLVDFKRRRKRKTNLDDKCKEKFDGSMECETPATEYLANVDSKRRKLVRPVFVRSESTNAANVTDMQPTADEITPLKDEDNLTKEVKSSEKSEHLSDGCKESVNEGEECLKVEGNGKVENCGFVEERDLSEENYAGYAPPSSEGDHNTCGWIEW